MPLLGRLQNQIIKRFADLVVLAVVCIGKVICHCIVLRIVAETLRNNGVTKEEGKVGEDVLLGSGNSARGRKGSSLLLRCPLHVTHTHFVFCGVVCGVVCGATRVCRKVCVARLAEKLTTLLSDLCS